MVSRSAKPSKSPDRLSAKLKTPHNVMRPSPINSRAYPETSCGNSLQHTPQPTNNSNYQNTIQQLKDELRSRDSELKHLKRGSRTGPSSVVSSNVVCRTSTDQIKYKQPRQSYNDSKEHMLIETMTNSSGLGTPNHHVGRQSENLHTHSSNQNSRLY